MIQLRQKADIILSYIREGKNISEIERETGITRKTIRKYLRGFELKKQSILDQDCSTEDMEVFIQDLVAAPQYNASSRKKRKATDQILYRIDEMLKENEVKRATGRSKQQLKKIDIYEKLAAEGFDISYPTIVRAVRQRESIKKEAFIKQDYDYGDVCEFDWGEVKLKIGDAPYKAFQMALFTSAKGNLRGGSLYQSQKMECFLHSHAEWFEELGGVYHTLVYDNMKTAVKRFVGRTEKEATDDLIKLSMYYGFRYRFCNARKGNEKGHVERSVEYNKKKDIWS